MDFDLTSIGLLGVALIIFTETGMLFGIFLPGDSLLLAAGLAATQGYFNIWILSGVCFLAAFIGNLIGYWIGQKFGFPLLAKYEQKFLDQEKTQKTRAFLLKHQNVGIVAARFIPGARTLAPVMAGALNINFIPFVFYSYIGALIWGAGLPVLGYYLGDLLPPSTLDYVLVPLLVFIAGLMAWPWIRGKLKK